MLALLERVDKSAKANGFHGTDVFSEGGSYKLPREVCIWRYRERSCLKEACRKQLRNRVDCLGWYDGMQRG